MEKVYYAYGNEIIIVPRLKIVFMLRGCVTFEINEVGSSDMMDLTLRPCWVVEIISFFCMDYMFNENFINHFHSKKNLQNSIFLNSLLSPTR